MTGEYAGTDEIFGGERLDRTSISDERFAHCTFANISFLEARLHNVEFLDCVFVDCYFRRASLKSCSFIGCHFFDSDFTKINLQGGCNFRHSRFSNCFLPFSEMEHSLPSEPNIREELARNLSVEAAHLGNHSESRSYRFADLHAREEHLLAAFKNRSQWYKQHYDTFRRFIALLQYATSRLNGILWGYGDSLWVLIRNYVVLIAVLFPTVFYFLREGLAKSGQASISWWDSLAFSIQNSIPSGAPFGMTACNRLTHSIAIAESVSSFVAASLFVSALFLWITRRS
jgi:Pentapeptide repeats (9 copies)